MKIGLYFGSFNPIHIGHLIIASAAASTNNVDKVWIIVSPQNPFKKTNSLLNEYSRLHLVQLAVEDDPLLTWSDLEFKLPRPSYTIDTLTYLQEKYPQHSFSIILGSDSFQNISNWKNGKLLLTDYDFLVYNRPGFQITSQSVSVHILDAPLLEISSSMIRDRLREKRSIRYLVSEIVREEIEKSGYYLSL